MRFKIKPVEVIQSPNFYSVLVDGNWIIYDESATRISFMLMIIDSLGERPYVTSPTDTIEVVFPRSDSISVQTTTRGTLESSSRTVNKPCIPDNINKSLFNIDLSSNDIKNVISGTAIFTLKYGTNTRTWPENYILIKKTNEVGI